MPDFVRNSHPSRVTFGADGHMRQHKCSYKVTISLRHHEPVAKDLFLDYFCMMVHMSNVGR